MTHATTMWTVQFWKDTAERGIKSTAQALTLAWPLADGVFDVFDVNPARAAGIALGAFVLSALTSLVSSQVGNTGTASVVSDVTYTPTP
jgi:hypothetical protein